MTFSAQQAQDIIAALEVQRNHALSALAMAQAEINDLKRKLAAPEASSLTPLISNEDS